MEQAGRYDITMLQGKTFRLRTFYKDANGLAIDLTGYAARMKARDAKGVTQINLTTANAGIVLGGVTGSVDLYLSYQATTLLKFDTCSYDIELVPNANDVEPYLTGFIQLIPEETYDD